MPLDPRNLNTLWSSVLVETLARLGLRRAAVCPGSRSAPLAVALAAHPQIEAVSVLDERSAGFLALGTAKPSGKAAVLVCTSGTAGANVYPAVVEARESRVPLLVLTADRPPELRHCQAGQAIDQQKLYGSYAVWYAELGLPELTVRSLAYLRQTAIHAWERTRFPVGGAVHLNCPFRDPLAPEIQPQTQEFFESLPDAFWEDFFAEIRDRPPARFLPASEVLEAAFSAWHQSDRGIIVAGIAQPQDSQRYCDRVAHLAKTFGFPVLAEGLSPIRNCAALSPHRVSTYDSLLRNPDLAAELRPNLVLQIGDLPTSKVLRAWLQETNAPTWTIDASDRNLDPLHGRTTHLRVAIERLPVDDPVVPPGASAFCKRWCELDARLQAAIAQRMRDTPELREPKLVWLLSQQLPADTAVFVANSTPVRDVEWFWQPGERRLRPFCNRGANGIDGTLSTAIGVALAGSPCVLLTGDLAFLHDTNGLLLARLLDRGGHLTVLLINNHGGGIFEMLPIAEFEPPFEEFFATPQPAHVGKLCAAYGVEHREVSSWEALRQMLSSLPERGLRVLEVRTDRRSDRDWRLQQFAELAQLGSEPLA